MVAALLYKKRESRFGDVRDTKKPQSQHDKQNQRGRSMCHSFTLSTPPCAIHIHYGVSITQNVASTVESERFFDEWIRYHLKDVSFFFILVIFTDL
jgi:hypothetical protein